MQDMPRKKRSLESGSDALGPPRLALHELCPELRREVGDDLVLHVEEVGERLVEALGP
jgi:hypothetical protein